MRARILGATVAAATAVAVLLFVTGSPPPAGSSAGGSGRDGQEVSLLFVQQAGSGSLEPVPGTDRYVLVLRGVSAQTTYFADRPARFFGQMPTAGFAEHWTGFGFGDDPPNAALSLLKGDAGADVVVLSLGRPRYVAQTGVLRYEARPDEASENLLDMAGEPDPSVPRRFGPVSLFIDDATGQVVNGCLIQPQTSCEGVDLSEADLAGADLHGATLNEAYFTETDLHGADLSGAHLIEAVLNNANLWTTNLADAEAFRADFTGAILTGADLDGADLDGATFDCATMPDGHVNDCE